MTVVAAKVGSHPLSYEDYMAEPEVMARYDILDGERIFMTQPTDQHQDIVLIVGSLLRAYQLWTKTCRAYISPCDVLITQSPLRTRQPDVMLVSRERNSGRKRRDASPHSPAPELVVEVLSPSDTRGVRMTKIRDYCRVDVKECWIIDTVAQTVEVLRLSVSGLEHAAIYNLGQSVTSLCFPDLSVTLDEIFEIDE